MLGTTSATGHGYSFQFTFVVYFENITDADIEREGSEMLMVARAYAQNFTERLSLSSSTIQTR